MTNSFYTLTHVCGFRCLTVRAGRGLLVCAASKTTSTNDKRNPWHRFATRRHHIS